MNFNNIPRCVGSNRPCFHKLGSLVVLFFLLFFPLFETRSSQGSRGFLVSNFLFFDLSHPTAFGTELYERYGSRKRPSFQLPFHHFFLFMLSAVSPVHFSFISCVLTTPLPLFFLMIFAAASSFLFLHFPFRIFSNSESNTPRDHAKSIGTSSFSIFPYVTLSFGLILLPQQYMRRPHIPV